MEIELQGLLSAVDISEVYWIDDLFDDPMSGEDRNTALRAAIAHAHQSGIVLSHSAFESLTGGEPLEIWIETLLDHIDANPRDDLASLLLEAAGTADYRTDSVEAILAAFGSNIFKWGLSQWRANSERILTGSISNKLFIVDRQFRIEGVSQDEGDVVVGSLVSADANAMVIMLTHSRPSDGLEELRREVATKSKVAVDSFHVVAKSAIEEPEKAVRTLKESLRAVFTYRKCDALVALFSRNLMEALKEAVEDLRGQSVYDLDRVVFENSIQEGASEVDVVIRILQVCQRVRAQQKLLDSRTEVHRILDPLRRIRTYVPDLPARSESSASPIAKWRRDEVYDSAAYINELYSPLACGDLFAKSSTALPSFILLEQPCDLVVRSVEGSRKASEGVLVKVVSTKAEPHIARHFFPAWDTQGEWHLDFRAWCSVRLENLELACYNSDGRVEIDATLDEATVAKRLLPGWQISYKKRRQAVVAAAAQSTRDIPPKLRLLSLSDSLKLGQATLSGKKLSFPLFRVGRLRQPRAINALAAFSAYRTRAAFDHDFAKGLLSDSGGGPDAEPNGDTDHAVSLSVNTGEAARQMATPPSGHVAEQAPSAEAGASSQPATSAQSAQEAPRAAKGSSPPPSGSSSPQPADGRGSPADGGIEERMAEGGTEQPDNVEAGVGSEIATSHAVPGTPTAVAPGEQ